MPKVLLFNLDTIAKNGLLGSGKSRRQLLIEAVEELLAGNGFPTDEQIEVLLKY